MTSRDLARWTGCTPESIRKDLASAGQGTPGAAYEVNALLQRLQTLAPEALPRRTALAGLGELGLALATPGSPWMFQAGFDGRPNRLEQADLPFPLFPTTEITAVCLRMSIEEAVLAVPAQDAQRVAERFVLAGVRSLVNYSPTVLRLDRHKVSVWEFGLAD